MKIITLRVADELYDISKQTSTSLNKTTKNIIADYLKSPRTIASFLSEIENNLLNSHKSTIDNLYMDKIKGLVDKEMYKRIYNKTNKEITRINMKLEELNKKKEVNEKQTTNNSKFSGCKNSVLDYMSLKNPTKDQIKRLVDRIEIDKDKKVYVYLKFPELLEEL